MSNWVFSPLDVTDAWIAVVVPLTVRICIWGLLAGLAAMGVYSLTSNQAVLSNLKQRTRELRRQMLGSSVDNAAEYFALSQQNLRLSLALLGRSIGPAFLSAAPVLFFAAWLNANHGYALPESPQGISATFVPATFRVQVIPQELARWENDNVSLVPPAPMSGNISLFVEGNRVYSGPLFEVPRPVVRKKEWWNFLLASEVGYLAPNAPIDEIRLDLSRKRIVPRVPAWAAGWEFAFFVSVFTSAIAVKAIFRLH